MPFRCSLRGKWGRGFFDARQVVRAGQLAEKTAPPFSPRRSGELFGQNHSPSISCYKSGLIWQTGSRKRKGVSAPNMRLNCEATFPNVLKSHKPRRKRDMKEIEDLPSKPIDSGGETRDGARSERLAPPVCLRYGVDFHAVK